jgi:hypothetical protein
MSTKFFYALVLTLATIVFQLVLYFSGFQTEKLATGQYLQWLGLVITALVLYQGIKAVRDEKPDHIMTYGQGVATGVTISLYAGLMGTVYSYIHFTFINTGFADHAIAFAREKWAARGMTQAQIESTEAISRKMMQPGVQAILGVLFAVLVGFIISLIVSAFLKRGKPAGAPSASTPS